MEERAGERRPVFVVYPSPQSSPHSFLAGRGVLLLYASAIMAAVSKCVLSALPRPSLVAAGAALE
jgi:hypothetical protein